MFFPARSTEVAPINSSTHRLVYDSKNCRRTLIVFLRRSSNFLYAFQNRRFYSLFIWTGMQESCSAVVRQKRISPKYYIWRRRERYELYIMSIAIAYCRKLYHRNRILPDFLAVDRGFHKINRIKCIERSQWLLHRGRRGSVSPCKY